MEAHKEVVTSLYWSGLENSSAGWRVEIGGFFLAIPISKSGKDRDGVVNIDPKLTGRNSL